MQSKVKWFRDRAVDCLNIAKSVRHQADREILEDLAADLELEARRQAAIESAVLE